LVDSDLKDSRVGNPLNLAGIPLSILKNAANSFGSKILNQNLGVKSINIVKKVRKNKDLHDKTSETRVLLNGGGNIVLDSQVRVGQNAGDEIVVDPRTGQLFLIKAALLGKKAVHKGKKVIKKLGPAAVVGGAGLKLLKSAAALGNPLNLAKIPLSILNNAGLGPLKSELNLAIDADGDGNVLVDGNGNLVLGAPGARELKSEDENDGASGFELNLAIDADGDGNVLVDGNGNLVLGAPGARELKSEDENDGASGFELNLAIDADGDGNVLVDGNGNLVLVDSELKADSTVRLVKSVDKDGRFQLSALNGVGGSSNLVSLNPGLHNTQLPVTNLVDLNTAFEGAQLMLGGSGNVVNVNTGLDNSLVGQNGDLELEDFQADARTGQSYRARVSRF